MRVLVLGGIRSGKSEWAETVIAASVRAGTQVILYPAKYKSGTLRAPFPAT